MGNSNFTSLFYFYSQKSVQRQTIGENVYSHTKTKESLEELTERIKINPNSLIVGLKVYWHPLTRNDLEVLVMRENLTLTDLEANPPIPAQPPEGILSVDFWRQCHMSTVLEVKITDNYTEFFVMDLWNDGLEIVSYMTAKRCYSHMRNNRTRVVFSLDVEPTSTVAMPLKDFHQILSQQYVDGYSRVTNNCQHLAGTIWSIISRSRPDAFFTEIISRWYLTETGEELADVGIPEISIVQWVGQCVYVYPRSAIVSPIWFRYRDNQWSWTPYSAGKIWFAITHETITTGVLQGTVVPEQQLSFIRYLRQHNGAIDVMIPRSQVPA